MTKSPSNLSPFDSDLQTFIVTKYDPLLSIVKDLNDRLQASEKERFRLERRINRLESNFLALQQAFDAADIPINVGLVDDSPRNTSEIKEILESEAAYIAQWLFSCQIGTATSSLQVLLEFVPKNTEELDVKLWKREEDMWIQFIEELPDEFLGVKPQSFELQDLRHAARHILLQVCKSELLLILRNVPGRLDVINNPMSITLVAIMASALSEAWERVDAINPLQLGRIALVLEGSEIGSRLRAGRKRFSIEPLN